MYLFSMYKKTNLVKNTTKMKDKRFKIKNENLFFVLLILLTIFTSGLFYCEKLFLFIQSLFKKDHK